MKPIEIDNHKLIYHPERVAEWKIHGDCFPIYVEIGLTNRCNHRCTFCALDWLQRGGKDINSKILCSNLEDMATSGVKSIMFAGEGEPFLHKDITLFIERAKAFGMDVSTTTNGAALNEKKIAEILPYLSWIRFSLDAGTPKTYAKVHGTREQDFDKVIKNIASTVKIRNNKNYQTTIGVQALLTKYSLNELEDLAKKLKKIGADNLQIKPYSHHPSSKNDISFDFSEAEKIRPRLERITNDQFQIAYRTNTIKRLNGEREYNECFGLPFFALIEADGNIIPCGLFYNRHEFSYGNINEQKFSDIWTGEKRKEVLKKICEMGTKECRKGCRLDAINRYLDRLKNPQPHDKFI